MILPQILFFFKHENNAENQNLDDSEGLISDFPGFRTSEASMTSLASATSMASTAIEALFYQKNLPDPDDWIIPGTKMTKGGPFLWNGSSKIQFFSVGGC
jgi:hypothetical protein